MTETKPNEQRPDIGREVGEGIARQSSRMRDFMRKPPARWAWLLALLLGLYVAWDLAGKALAYQRKSDRPIFVLERIDPLSAVIDPGVSRVTATIKNVGRSAALGVSSICFVEILPDEKAFPYPREGNRPSMEPQVPLTIPCHTNHLSQAALGSARVNPAIRIRATVTVVYRDTFDNSLATKFERFHSEESGWYTPPLAPDREELFPAKFIKSRK